MRVKHCVEDISEYAVARPWAAAHTVSRCPTSLQLRRRCWNEEFSSGMTQHPLQHCFVQRARLAKRPTAQMMFRPRALRSTLLGCSRCIPLGRLRPVRRRQSFLHTRCKNHHRTYGLSTDCLRLCYSIDCPMLCPPGKLTLCWSHPFHSSRYRCDARCPQMRADMETPRSWA